jgi:hypothetical protein
MKHIMDFMIENPGTSLLTAIFFTVWLALLLDGLAEIIRAFRRR